MFLADYVPESFYVSVLAGIGAPVTYNNLSILKAWQATEGGRALNNPLNTTQHAAGSWSFNSAGVQNYPDVPTGVAATVHTLLNGHYPYIVDAFRRNLPLKKWKSPGITQNLRTWGSVTFVSQIVNSSGFKLIPIIQNIFHQLFPRR